MQRLDYFPPHFAQTRPYVKEFLRDVDARMKTHFNAQDIMEIASRHVAKGFFDKGVVPGSAALDPQAFALECRCALLYNAWRLEGGVIYDFNPQLTQALRQSSLADVCINDLQYPFETLYFSFGPLDGLALASGAPVTGAYVYYAPGYALRISLTAPLAADTPAIARGYELFDLGIKEKHFSASLEEAVKLALEDDLNDIRQALATRKANSKALELDETVPTLERLLETQAAQFGVFQEVVQLVANGLCYASAYRDDVREKWQSSTPEKMRIKAEGEGKEAHRAASKLLSMGYRKVRYLGEDFSAGDDAGTVAPHMRRAHWRNQAYGPGFSQHRLVWIRRTRVLGGATSEEPHIYRDTTGGRAG